MVGPGDRWDTDDLELDELDDLDDLDLDATPGDSMDALLREVMRAPAVPVSTWSDSLAGGLARLSRREAPVLEAPVRLGAFDLRALLGRGGMGEVWSGMHREQGLPVAIKVMSGAQARLPEVLSAFRGEVRAVARLSHPRVVLVLDYGAISAEVEAKTGGHLVAGSPYLVMEYASAGSLAELPWPTSWAGLQGLLLELLEALGHAHARGVIHRDLKPGNLLVCGAESLRPGLKVADFGLAHAMDPQAVRRGRTEAIRGTPHYMAPEQITGEFRDQGPWTDLYAVGCIAWQMATGRPPFDAPTLVELTRAHLEAALPPLEPRVVLPQGFEGWVARLLAKAPQDRFASAAEAAWALQGLGGAGPVGAPPVPEVWRDDGAVRLSMPLVGAGLGLYGLRAVPMVGRLAEREQLWGALRQVEQEGRAQVMLLSGPAGTGKSRLAEWLTERAYAMAGVLTLRAGHSPMGGAADGIPAMLGRALQSRGLGRRDTLQRVEAALVAQGVGDPWEAQALTELIHPASSAEERQAVFRSAREWHAVVRRFVQRSRRGSPLVLWFDDIQWGSDALDFVGTLLQQQRVEPAPLLILLTARSEALAEHPQEARQLDALLAQAEVRRVEVAPLSPAETRTLLAELLGLSEELAIRLEARCAGNPLFAVQLVADWVERGVLEVGRDGFVLHKGEAARLPDDIHHIWSERVERLLSGLPPGSGRGLALAAALGQTVHLQEWEDVCQQEQVPPIAPLLDALLESHLARLDGPGWSFVHGMLRESLERGAQERGELQALHDRCAAMLQARYPAARHGVAERIGRHLLAAGRVEEAWQPLLDGAWLRSQASQYQPALALLLEAESALQRLGAAPSDVRWGVAWTRRARCHELMGAHEASAELASRAAQAARTWGWTGVLGRALQSLGHVARHRGAFEEAARAFGEAVTVLRSEEGAACGDALLGLATVELARARARGDAQLAAAGVQLAEEALELHRAADNAFGVTTALQTLAVAAVRAGEPARAAALYEEALARYRAHGNGLGMALCLNGLGEVLRSRGELEEAAGAYEQAVVLFEATGSAEAAVARANLGLILLRRGCFEEARSVLWTCQRELERTSSALIAYIHVALLVCCAAAEDWTSWDRELRAAEPLLVAAHMADKDLAWPAQLAGDLAVQAGEEGRARGAYQIAEIQWQRLQRAEEAAAVAALLARLYTGSSR